MLAGRSGVGIGRPSGKVVSDPERDEAPQGRGEYRGVVGNCRETVLWSGSLALIGTILGVDATNDA